MQPLAQKANASSLAVCGEGDQSFYLIFYYYFLFCLDVNGGEASLRWINSLFNKLSAYLLIFNMFYTKQYFWTDLFLEFINVYTNIFL